MITSKYYISRVYLNTALYGKQTQTVKTEDVLTSIRKINELARKRLNVLRRAADIEPSFYANLENAYKTPSEVIGSKDFNNISLGQRYSLMKYLNKMEIILFENKTSAKDIRKRKKEAVDYFNEAMGTTLNQRQYKQVNNVLRVMRMVLKLDDNTFSEQAKRIVQAYDGATYGDRTIRGDRLIELMKEFVEKEDADVIRENFERSRKLKRNTGKNKSSGKRSKAKGQPVRKTRRYVR